ncbi:hypothetical protein V494_01207 [Pseudogymnoascus sp. VKM F-4513 (FW-928)]|nr:hypothetical protein V494_01207 [Pseudogymnoascus sp. VKM F-4513 (FW-928)]
MAPCATSEEPQGLMSFTSTVDERVVTKAVTIPIQASVLHGPRDIRLETRQIAPPQDDELQIAIKATGICGSDVSYYKKFANGDLCACSPLSLGHESSGVVVAMGAQVKNFTIGDRVALEVGIPCGNCGVCRGGRYNLCKKMRFRSSAKSVPHFQGTLQERINHPARWCYKLPSTVSFAAAALLEPLSVAIHAVSRAAVTSGTSALVLGAGTVGLLTAAMARQSGCHTVTIADLSAPRVAYALKHGFATHGYVVPPSSLSPSTTSSGTSTPASSSTAPFSTPISRYAETTLQLAAAKALAADLIGVTQKAPEDDDVDDVGVDYTFECTGVEMCMQTSLYATRPGGKAAIVGMGTPIQTLPLSAAQLREVDLVGVFRYANTYERAIRIVEGGAQMRAQGLGGFPDLDGMVTHRIKGLGEAQKGMELACRTTDGEGGLVVKVVIET